MELVVVSWIISFSWIVFASIVRGIIAVRVIAVIRTTWAIWVISWIIMVTIAILFDITSWFILSIVVRRKVGGLLIVLISSVNKIWQILK